MRRMVVTLEVSQLSGWLKADARCRVEGRAHAMRGGEVRAGRREGLGWWRHTRGMHGEKARLKAWRPRARAERTLNMKNMVVTLEVSKLSGWLKAVVRCAESKGGHATRGGEVRAGRREGLGCMVAAHKRHARGRPDSRLWGQGHARSARGT